MDRQSLTPALAGVHVSPPFVEVKMPPAAAASRIPSAEETMENQLVLGALLFAHVLPEFVEV